MKRIAIGTVAAILAVAVSAGGAFGASSKPFQAVVGKYKTTASASKAEKKLTAKKLTGFTMETEKGKGAKYEVEKGYATQKQAKSEVAKLHKDGFKGASVENEKTEKSA